jgi:hypothetical protein
MSIRSRITVLMDIDAFARLRDCMAAVEAALGPGSEIVLRCPTHLIEDIQRSSGGWEGVRLVPEGFAAEEVRSVVRTPYVLVIPPASPLAIFGIATASAILDSDETIHEVGGLVVSSPRSIVSGALVEVDRTSTGAIAVAPVEMMDPSWTARAGGATTPVDMLGGLVLIRSEMLSSAHLDPGSILTRALASVRSGPGSTRVLFSGLAVLSRRGADSAFPDSGAVERLPEATYVTWSELGLQEVRVLHRGHAVRDDDRRHVVLIADNRVAAVDDRGQRVPEDPASYYRPIGSHRQLGPAFSSLLDILDGPGTPASARSDVTFYPSKLELQFLAKARRLAASMPSPVLTLAKRLVRSGTRA